MLHSVGLNGKTAIFRGAEIRAPPILVARPLCHRQLKFLQRMIDAIVTDERFPAGDALEAIQSFYTCQARVRNLSARIELNLKFGTFGINQSA